jgi:hypothetical protein
MVGNAHPTALAPARITPCPLTLSSARGAPRFQTWGKGASRANSESGGPVSSDRLPAVDSWIFGSLTIDTGFFCCRTIGIWLFRSLTVAARLLHSFGRGSVAPFFRVRLGVAALLIVNGRCAMGR